MSPELTIQQALEFGRKQLSASPTPVLDTRLLLQHVLQRNHAYIIAHLQKRLTETQEQQFNNMVERAVQREPIPYIVGFTYFFGHRFVVNQAVLVPRPETEIMVQKAIDWYLANESWWRPLL